MKISVERNNGRQRALGGIVAVRSIVVSRSGAMIDRRRPCSPICTLIARLGPRCGACPSHGSDASRLPKIRRYVVKPSAEAMPAWSPWSLSNCCWRNAAASDEPEIQLGLAIPVWGWRWSTCVTVSR